MENNFDIKTLIKMQKNTGGIYLSTKVSLLEFTRNSGNFQKVLRRNKNHIFRIAITERYVRSLHNNAFGQAAT